MNMFFVKDDKNGVPEQLNAMLGKKLPQHAAGAISTLVTVEKDEDSKKKPGQRYVVMTITIYCCNYITLVFLLSHNCI